MSPQNLKGETVRPPLFAGFGKDVGDGWRTDDTCMCWYARHPSESRVFPCRFLRTAWCYSISGSRVYCVLYPGFIFCVNKLRLKQNLTNWLLYAQVCRNACHNFHLLSSFSRPTLFPDKPLLDTAPPPPSNILRLVGLFLHSITSFLQSGEELP